MAASPLAARYESLSLRERALVALAVLGIGIYLWDSVFMESLRQSRLALASELATASVSGVVAASADLSDPRQVNLRRAAELQRHVQSLDAQLTSSTSGFVSSEKMVEVLNDVLDRQGRLELVSIRNLEVKSLPKLVAENAAKQRNTSAADGSAAPQPEPEPELGLGPAPYVHPIEIIIEGQYADIVDYLQALEKLPYKFHWRSLELRAAGYPRNRVRIVLATFSLDSTWLGV